MMLAQVSDIEMANSTLGVFEDAAKLETSRAPDQLQAAMTAPVQIA